MLSICTFDLGQPGRLKLGMIKCILLNFMVFLGFYNCIVFV